MFMIEALIYTIVAGKLLGQPQIVHPDVTFKSEEACMEELNSPTFIGYRIQLANAAAPEPSTGAAVTGRCVPDDRL